MTSKVRRRWRFYETATGRQPVREFLDSLSGDDVAAVAAGMRDVARNGLIAARHIRGGIYEVREDGEHQTFRILFAAEASAGKSFSPSKRSPRPGAPHRPPSTWRSGASPTGADAAGAQTSSHY